MGPRAPDAPPPSLAGRDAELDRIDRCLRGRGQMASALVVEGDPGVGKTALGRVVARRELERGATVLSAAGVQSEVDIGFAGLTQLLAPVVDLVHQLPPDQRDDLYAALGYEELGSRRSPHVAAAVRHLFENLGRSAPVVVIVDDLQWIDSATADVLGQTARSLGATNDVRLLVLQRTGVHTYFDTSGFPFLRIGPLPDAAAEALVRGRFPSIDQRVLARVLAESDGHPLALLELPTALDASHRTADQELPTHLPFTQRLQSLYGNRILSLPPATRHLVLVAALGGTEAPVPVQDWSERLRVLAPAERAGLLELDRGDGRVRFRHPLVRSTVIDLATAQDRRQAHTVLATSSAVDADRMAWHLAAAALVPDEGVANLLEAAAARALRRGDAAGAVRTLVRAAELSPDRAERARRLADAAYRGADVGADLQRAARLLEDADRVDPGARPTLEAAVATAYLLLNGAGDTQTAHRVLVAALEEASRSGSADVETVAEAVHNLCEICLYAAQPALWPAYHAAVRMVPLERYPVLALWDQIMIDPARNAHTALPRLERALHSLERERDPVRIERVAAAAVFVDRVELARDPLLRLIDDAQAGTSVGSGILALMLLSVEDFHRGRWSQVRDSAALGMRLVSEHGLDLLAWPLKLAQAWLAAGTGDQDGLRVLLDQMLAWATPRQAGTVLHYAHHAAGLDALGRGDYETAFRELSAVSRPGDLRSHVGHALWAAMDLVEAAVHAGHRAAAAAHVTAMRRARVGELSGRLRLTVAAAEAMSAEPLDRKLFDQALETPGAHEWPFELARMRLFYGQRLRRDRAAAAARPHLQLALDTFVDLGARPWAERAGQELEATSPVKLRTDWHHLDTPLTPQEHQVASLASRGLTNQQIGDQLLISPRTVGAHLQSIYRKLDVAGRGGLHNALTTRTASVLVPSHPD